MGKDVRLFYLYRIASRFYFHLPILFVFFYVQALGLIQVELLLAAYGLAIVATANLGVTWLRSLKRKHVLLAGEVLKAVGLLVIVADPQNFWTDLVGQALAGAGFSLGISNDSTLLRSVVAERGGDLFNKVVSNTQSYMFIATMVSGIIGAVLFSQMRVLPFFASVAANVVALVAAAAISEPEPREAAAGASGSGKTTPPVKPIEWLWMHFYIVGRAIPLAVFVGFLPYQFFVIEHVSLALFGAVLSLFSLGAFVSARYVGQITARIGAVGLVTVALLLMAASILGFAISAMVVVSLVAISLLGLGAGCVRPLTMRSLSATAGGTLNRLASIMEQRYGAANALLLVVGGVILAQFGLRQVYVFLDVLLVLLWLTLLLALRTIQTRSVKATVPTGD
jgi:predicted MFS family arabinose efflux permease